MRRFTCVLLALSIGLGMISCASSSSYNDERNPVWVVKRYLDALSHGNYHRAISYLSVKGKKHQDRKENSFTKICCLLPQAPRPTHFQMMRKKKVSRGRIYISMNVWLKAPNSSETRKKGVHFKLAPQPDGTWLIDEVDPRRKPYIRR